MYAVVDIKGFQYKLEKGDTLRVPKFDLEVGKKIELSDVLLVADSGSFSIGKPYVDGAVVEATVTGQGKHDKILVFKKKRRKDYSVKRGHRQDYTEISIDGIEISGKKSKKADEEPSPQTEAVEVISEVVEAAEMISEAVEVAEVKSEQVEAAELKSETVEAAEVKSEAMEIETAVSVEKIEKKTRAPRKKKDITE